MSDIPGIGIFESHEITKKVDNDSEIEITTFAVIGPKDKENLVKAGWVQRAPNVMAYIKPRYLNRDELVPNLQETKVDWDKLAKELDKIADEE